MELAPARPFLTEPSVNRSKEASGKFGIVSAVGRARGVGATAVGRIGDGGGSPHSVPRSCRGQVGIGGEALMTDSIGASFNRDW